LTGTIVDVRAETADTRTVVVRPTRAWPGHRAGQYVRIGVTLDGRRHWRAYSLTSDPGDAVLSVTVKHVAAGEVSPFFARDARPGALVFLGEAEGVFTLPDPTPDRVLMLSAGSGITPIRALLRELDRRGAPADVVHVHSARDADDVVFGAELRALAAARPGYALVEHHSAAAGRLAPADLDDLCPDWRDRAAFLSAPRAMLDAFGARWTDDGDPARLSVERFQPVIGTGAGDSTGGTVRLRASGVEAVCAPGVSVLAGAEEAGVALRHGCRMGICHTCLGRLTSGRLRDLRTGEIVEGDDRFVRICVNAPEGDVELDL
jgi:ferredoxin-NADP reductase